MFLRAIAPRSLSAPTPRQCRRGRCRAAFAVRLACVFATVAAAVLAGSAPGLSAPVRPGPQLLAGRGFWVAGHTDFVGFYRALVGGRWAKVYCVSPDRRSPSRVRLRAVQRVPAASRRTTHEIAEILWAHGDARTARAAAAVSQALNTELGNSAAVARRARLLPAQVGRLAARYLAEARHRHGPYRLAVRLPSSPLPGRSGVGTVTLRGPAGPVPGVVRLQHTGNASMPGMLRLGRSGTARFTYRTVGGGAVHVRATARSAPSRVLASRPGAATQLLLSSAPTAAARGYATYQAGGPGFGHRYACTAECAGRPAVTLTACAPANRYPSRITFWLGDQTHRIGFPAAAARSCRSWTVRIADGTAVSATWQYGSPEGWTRPLPASGAFVVDCPAAPPVAVLLSYDCSAAVLFATLGTQQDGALRPLRNTSRHPMLLLVDGALRDRVEVPPGATAAVRDYPVECGSHATVTLRGGVQRGAGGGFNFGQPLAVTLP
jgi:hypothetical protein